MQVKIVIALIGTTVLLMLAMVIAQYVGTGDFDIMQVAIAVTMVILSGVPYRIRLPTPRPKVGRRKS